LGGGGLGAGGSAPHPHTPIPNPQSPIPILNKIKYFDIFIKNKNKFLNILYMIIYL
jgi:hypothetical protein